MARQSLMQHVVLLSYLLSKRQISLPRASLPRTKHENFSPEKKYSLECKTSNSLIHLFTHRIFYLAIFLGIRHCIESGNAKINMNQAQPLKELTVQWVQQTHRNQIIMKQCGNRHSASEGTKNKQLNKDLSRSGTSCQ